jgi:hypothetical protein
METNLHEDLVEEEEDAFEGPFDQDDVIDSVRRRIRYACCAIAIAID